MTCSLLHIHSLLGKKWTLLILQHLNHEGSQSFNQLLGVLKVPTNKILSTRLSELQKEQIILRKIISEQPLQVEYSLTEKGRSLVEVVNLTKQWAKKYGDVPQHCAERNCTTCDNQELTHFSHT